MALPSGLTGLGLSYRRKYNFVAKMLKQIAFIALLGASLSLVLGSDNKGVDPGAGSACDPTVNCTIDWDCEGWWYCHKTDETNDPHKKNIGTWARVDCNGKKLWAVGQKANNSEGGYVTGACVEWTALPEPIKKECSQSHPVCELVPVGENPNCTSQYQYKNDAGDLSDVLTCPNNRKINVLTKTCEDRVC